ncbi:MAG: patatin-like phospholipase family protein [Chloroflexota bacterium]|jgi:NTE family protein
MKLGLALSGGGFRATVYHLGVLARLAREDRLEEVTYLSTVSGGSLCVGLVYALNGFRWPSSQAYLEVVMPQARQHMLHDDFTAGLLWRMLRRPWGILETKADDLSALLNKLWGVSIALRELPAHPRWMINATCYETGKNWRFERFRMGDYVFGYSHDMEVPLSDALAASAGFPGLIGPLVMDTTRHTWFRYRQPARDELGTGAGEQDVQGKTEPVAPAFKRVHLWDGGVYDNHGLEGVHDFQSGWRQGVDFLIVSDGSGKPTVEKYRVGGVFLRIITGVMMDQIRSLRARAIMERIKNHGDQGVILTIGNSCAAVMQAAERQAELMDLCQTCLSAEDAGHAGQFPTTIRRLTGAEFELLFRHGHEVADYTLHGHYPDQFGHITYRA